MTHLILNAADTDGWQRHHSGGLLIPDTIKPKVLQKDRDAAERECLRLAREHGHGLFVLFAPVALAKRLPEATHVNLKGEVMRSANVARLLPIFGPENEIPF